MRLTHQMKILLIGVLLTSLLMIIFGAYPLVLFEMPCDCFTKQDKNLHGSTQQNVTEGHPVHSLCLIVPFRDRVEELLEFAPYIHNFLNDQKVSHTIFVVNQGDKHRFNRASLINVGFLESEGHCDYIGMHDVDLLPLNKDLHYTYPLHGPVHIASPDLHPRYHYKTFVGGILLMRRDHFLRVNGLSNHYWGWGLEDDELYVRIISARLNITRPVGITSGRNNTFRHIHDRTKRQRDTVKLYNQKEVTRRRDRLTGVRNVKYRLVKRHNLVIDNAPIIMLNVELICNYAETPWCDNTHSGTKATKSPLTKL